MAMKRYRFMALADNYGVPRGYLRGTLTTHQGFDESAYVVSFEGVPKSAHHATYVLDFGTSVEVRWVAGWASEDLNQIFLQPFPLNGGTRPDNGRPIDMSMWMLGPRTAFHLKLTEIEKW